jgi:hypothetical protein
MSYHKSAGNLVMALVMLIAPSTGFTSKKTVNCLIESDWLPSYKGKCLFLRDKGGSFSLDSADESKPILDGVRDISISIIDKDTAEVRGLTLDGINSRWGEAKRDSKDKACWVGSDFKICAW